MSIQSINPSTEEVIRAFEAHSAEQVNATLDAASTAFSSWSETSFAERSSYLHTIASLLREQKERLAQFSTLEMGKPIVEAEAEIEKCAWACDFYAENAQRHPELCLISPPRRHFRYHALELSLLASFSLCGCRSYGWQYRCFKACLQCIASGTGDRTPFPGKPSSS
jgi:acyl-CoA reductase-like NAD-dependent aldehyde dehydrogenase